MLYYGRDHLRSEERVRLQPLGLDDQLHNAV